SVGFGGLGGVLRATFLGIFVIPVFYVWIRSIFKYKPKTINTQEHKAGCKKYGLFPVVALQCLHLRVIWQLVKACAAQ
ncbi:hypothetical protein DWA06_20885, partial [Acinetobacter baumannii]